MKKSGKDVKKKDDPAKTAEAEKDEKVSPSRHVAHSPRLSLFLG